LSLDLASKACSASSLNKSLRHGHASQQY